HPERPRQARQLLEVSVLSGADQDGPHVPVHGTALPIISEALSATRTSAFPDRLRASLSNHRICLLAIRRVLAAILRRASSRGISPFTTPSNSRTPMDPITCSLTGSPPLTMSYIFSASSRPSRAIRV